MNEPIRRYADMSSSELLDHLDELIDAIAQRYPDVAYELLGVDYRTMAEDAEGVA